MSTTTILDLPPELLTRIFKRLDWRSRIQCEGVSKKFREICQEMCNGTVHPFVDLPKQLTIVISTPFVSPLDGSWNRPHKSALQQETLEIKLLFEEATTEKFPDIFRGILEKFAQYTELLVIRGINLSSRTMELLDQFGHLLGKVKLDNCNLVNVPAIVIERMRATFTEKCVGRSSLERRETTIGMLLIRGTY